jgi:PAS domain S-box-containing protein
MDTPYKKQITLASYFVMLVGALIIIGWIVRIPFLMTVFPGYISMKFNTALSFVLTGFVLYANINNRFVVFSKVIAVVIIFFAGFILSQDITGKSYGIDEWLIKDDFLPGLNNGLPGRMASSTSFSFICIQLAFLFSTLKNRKVILSSQLLFHIITFVSFIAILGYAFETPILYRLSFLTSMAFHTALLFFIISIAAALIRPGVGLIRIFTSKQLGDVLASKIFPFMLIVFVTFGYLRILSYRYALISVESGIAIYTAIIILAVLIILFRTANWINQIDAKRTNAELELRKINITLEQKVTKRTEELNAIFDAAHVSIIATDRSGIITHFNRGAELMLGYKAEEIVGKQTPLLFHLPKEVAERGQILSKEFGYPVQAFDVFVQPIIKESFVSTNWTYVKKDGTTFPAQLVVTAIKNVANKIDGFLGIAIDISELYHTKENLTVLADQLQKKNAKLLNFAHVASHNLRSPAGNLNALLSFYKMSNDETEKSLLFEKIETVSNSLGETLNNLVDSLKYQEDTDLKFQSLSFETVLAKIKQDISGQILQTGASITTDFSEVSHINYPKDYLESILLNLLSNAIKYRSPLRSIHIQLETKIVNGNTVLTVTDNGLGIDMKKHGNKLFGLNKTFHGNAEAKGVGLFIIKTQIEALGGTISAESEIDKGTTFTIVFNKS